MSNDNGTLKFIRVQAKTSKLDEFGDVIYDSALFWLNDRNNPDKTEADVLAEAREYFLTLKVQNTTQYIVMEKVYVLSTTLSEDGTESLETQNVYSYLANAYGNWAMKPMSPAPDGTERHFRTRQVVKAVTPQEAATPEASTAPATKSTNKAPAF